MRVTKITLNTNTMLMEALIRNSLPSEVETDAIKHQFNERTTKHLINKVLQDYSPETAEEFVDAFHEVALHWFLLTTSSLVEDSQMEEVADE